MSTFRDPMSTFQAPMYTFLDHSHFNISLGHSILSIIKELKRRRIESSSGNEKWNKHYIEKMLHNHKYAGDSTINTGGGTYLCSNHHPAIIERSIFDVVQHQGEMRSNISINEDGTASRKNTRYSGKTVLRKLSISIN